MYLGDRYFIESVGRVSLSIFCCCIWYLWHIKTISVNIATFTRCQKATVLNNNNYFCNSRLKQPYSTTMVLKLKIIKRGGTGGNKATFACDIFKAQSTISTILWVGLTNCSPSEHVFKFPAAAKQHLTSPQFSSTRLKIKKNIFGTRTKFVPPLDRHNIVLKRSTMENWLKR